MTSTDPADLLGGYQIQARAAATTRGMSFFAQTTLILHAADWQGATAALASRDWPAYTIADTPAQHSVYSYWWIAEADQSSKSLTGIVGVEPPSFQNRAREADLWRPKTPFRFDDQAWKRLVDDGVLGVAGVLRPELLDAHDRGWKLEIEYAGARSGSVARAFGDTDHSFLPFRGLQIGVHFT